MDLKKKVEFSGWSPKSEAQDKSRLDKTWADSWDWGLCSFRPQLSQAGLSRFSTKPGWSNEENRLSTEFKVLKPVQHQRALELEKSLVSGDEIATWQSLAAKKGNRHNIRADGMISGWSVFAVRCIWIRLSVTADSQASCTTASFCDSAYPVRSACRRLSDFWRALFWAPSCASLHCW